MESNTTTTTRKGNMVFESDNPSGELLYMDAPEEGIKNKRLKTQGNDAVLTCWMLRLGRHFFVKKNES